MRIRTKLVLAFLLLAIVPLATIVFVNYLSSIEIFRRAVEDEVRTQAMELSDRMDEARDDLGRKIRAFGSMSLGTLAQDDLPDGLGAMTPVRPLDRLGELAPMVESVEVIPMPGLPTEPALAPMAEGIETPRTFDREALGESGLPDSFVIYLDRLLEAAERTEENPEAMEQDAREATEDFFRELGEGLGAHAERFAAEAQRADQQIAHNERQVEELSTALRNPTLSSEQRDDLNLERRQAAMSLRRAARQRKRLEHEEVEALEAGWEQAKSILGRSFDWRIQRDGKVIGEVRAQISPQNLLASILGQARRDQGEIPFALGPDRELYTVGSEDHQILEQLELERLTTDSSGPYVAFQDKWLIVASTDPESDVTLGIARPIAESLAAMRRNAVRNFGFGLGAIAFAMIGILPLSRRMTHNIRSLSRSVDRLAAGEAEVAVDIRSRDEIGQLARNFNRMAADLHDQRERLIAEVRRREEQETRERLLEAENERKSRELEDARLFQLSLLPSALPEHPDLAVAVHMQTATEVGGDYYDFLPGADGSLTFAIGDATGHGAKAGTMVTAIKSLFMASAGEVEPAAFLEQSSDAIKRMNLGRMAMALTLARYCRGEMRMASAGMPPPLLWHARSAEVEEIDLSGLPLGGLAGTAYAQVSRHLEQGDLVLMMSDGFPELADPDGEPLGYPAAKEAFARLAPEAPADILAGLAAVASDWRGERALLDDITFVIVQVKGTLNSSDSYTSSNTAPHPPAFPAARRFRRH